MFVHASSGKDVAARRCDLPLEARTRQLSWARAGRPSSSDRCASRRGVLNVLVGPGKLSCVNLHVQGRGDVQQVLADHGPWLSCYRVCLDQCVQEAGGYWEEPGHPEFLNVDPCTRSAHVRALAGAVVARWPSTVGSLRLKVVSFSGLHLYTPDGQRIRTRTRPRIPKSHLRMHASEQQWIMEPLPGFDPVVQTYELSVLLDIDLGTKTLYKAALAAIDWGVDDKGREIYYEEEIPPPAAGYGDSGPGGSGREPYSGPPVDDDFDDMLDNGEEVTGSDPA
jgi:hypothetical protein